MIGLSGIPTDETPIDPGPTDSGDGSTPSPQPSAPPPTPQPPTAPPPQATRTDLTLADVQPPAASQQPTLAEKFQQYKQLMDEVNKGSVREHLPESTKPGLLANILTMGFAGLADSAYRSGYNSRIDAQNAALQHSSVKDALAMVADDARSQNA